MQKQHKPKD